MLLTINDSSQVVAKVPNLNAGLPHFTTASEVATMDFVSFSSNIYTQNLMSQARNVLENPVPKVLAWCSQAHETPVGAEYVIMEQVPGIELEHVWPKMNIRDRLAIVKAVAEFQKSWTSVSFTMYGSLYFSKDLNDAPNNHPLYVDAAGGYIKSARYSVGPSTGRENIDNGRATVDFDRGPCRILICTKRSLN